MSAGSPTGFITTQITFSLQYFREFQCHQLLAQWCIQEYIDMRIKSWLSHMLFCWFFFKSFQIAYVVLFFF
jgi:hypothetical protein